MTDSTIAFIGLGLIGGSIARYEDYGIHADPFQALKRPG